MTVAESNFVNLTAFTMSPHLGTHADAPNHVRGVLENVDEISASRESIGWAPLSPYVGSAIVVDLAPFDGGIEASAAEMMFSGYPDGSIERVLFRTQTSQDSSKFRESYAHLTVELVDKLCQRGIKLIGIDTPSVDHIDSEQLEVHHRLLDQNLFCLENLDLSSVAAGQYFLVALPLKFMELEASPVRAVLLSY